VAAGAGIGVVVVTTVGQTLTPLEPLGLLAVRQPALGPQGVPVNRTAEQAGVGAAATDPSWRLEVKGPQPYAISLADLESLAVHEGRYPISCVEGWSANADWLGLSLLDVVIRAGGGATSHVSVVSVEQGGYSSSQVFGPQLGVALLATHLNGERLNLDHGYPLRLIVPNRPGVLNTKWLTRVEIS
jgi:DMSO/TMAO reductase YedYZ molybdopterin-dependent catalytic subunit